MSILRKTIEDFSGAYKRLSERIDASKTQWNDLARQQFINVTQKELESPYRKILKEMEALAALLEEAQRNVH